MAASQLECLEEDNVNVQLSECFPQFVYCERQRHALEALMGEGLGAFHQCVKREGLRPFLSAEEARRIHASAEDYRHGMGAAGPGEGEGEEGSEKGQDLSLTYWPVKSDTQAPYLALGWPETGMWRGITRVTVYTHPPMENTPTIKEVIRKLLQKANQVTAVVMDTFTDVDIFMDLVEAASRRRVPAYILLSQTNLPQFITMTEGTGTKLLLLDNISVRVLSGCSFCSRKGKKVTGDVKEKFLLVDGETVITGSYSFTWADARLDRNLATLLTGQVIDAFDREFRTLYAASRPLRLSDFSRPAPADPPPAPPPLANGYSPGGPALPRPEPLPPPARRRHMGAPAPPPPARPSRHVADPGRAGPRPTFRQTVTLWRGAKGAHGAETSQALSDILRRARQAASGPSAPPPKASKSMWDLSALSQFSDTSFGSNSALDHLELGEDAKSRTVTTLATPAATLMRHRDALKDEEVPAKPRTPRTFYPTRPLALVSPANFRRGTARAWGPKNRAVDARLAQR
ncbi:protein FAM83E-like [Carcharodon carcharias]|uniref:protein FAM83E-like n=1 Tax=Carcharodon carcharias TaxID=13397 RepID=UPI001B7F40FE|nr:protein FAM83E-like [Carcharodon carcharias]